MQIGGKIIENFLMNMVLEKKTLKRPWSNTTPCHASSFEKWAKQILVWNFLTYDDNLWNLQLFYPKLALMNHLHYNKK